MKKIALIGSHGTGKSTVVKGIRKEFGDRFGYIGELNRILVPQLGYKRPRDIVLESGIGDYVAAMIGAYSVIEEQFNCLNGDKHLLLDRAPVDFLGYYQVYLKKNGQEPTPFVYKLAKIYMEKIDQFFYFPVGVIPLEADDMRPGGNKKEEQFQRAVDTEIRQAIKDLAINEGKIHYIQNIGIEERIEEAIEVVSGVIK